MSNSSSLVPMAKSLAPSGNSPLCKGAFAGSSALERDIIRASLMIGPWEGNSPTVDSSRFQYFGMAADNNDDDDEEEAAKDLRDLLEEKAKDVDKERRAGEIINTFQPSICRGMVFSEQNHKGEDQLV